MALSEKIGLGNNHVWMLKILVGMADMRWAHWSTPAGGMDSQTPVLPELVQCQVYCINSDIVLP